jgi:hypothetical protein
MPFGGTIEIIEFSAYVTVMESYWCKDSRLFLLRRVTRAYERFCGSEQPQGIARPRPIEVFLRITAPLSGKGKGCPEGRRAALVC